MNKIFLTLCLFLVAIATTVQGQNQVSEEKLNSAEVTLSLNEAVNYAVSHNRTLQNASLSIKEKEQEKWSSIAKLLPQANATVDGTNYLGYEAMFGGTLIDMKPASNLAAQVSVGVSAAAIIGIQISKIAKEMSETNFKQTEVDIKNQVKSVYYSVLISQNTVNLLTKSLDNLKKLEELTKQSVAVGVSEETDADQIEIQVYSMQNNISANKRRIEVSLNMLHVLLGIDIDRQIVLTDELSHIDIAEATMSLLSQEFQVRNNYSYKLTLDQEDLASKQLKMAEWAYAPSISAYYSYTYKILQPVLDLSPNNVVGMQINIPLFSSGDRFAQTKAKKFALQAAKNTTADVEMQLLTQNKQLRYNISSAFENYENQKKNVEVSEKVFNNIGLKYAQGMASSLDLTNSSNNLINAQTTYITAVYELLNAQLELEKLLNRE